MRHPVESVALDAGDWVLDQPTAADAPAIVATFLDDQISAWNPPGDASLEPAAAATEWIERRRDWSKGDHASWVIRSPITGDIAGQISLHEFVPSVDAAQIGYWVLPEFRRRGVASAALKAATRYGFEVLELHRIELCHAVDNDASCRVALGQGYALEATLRSSYRYGDGRLHDEHVHARLSTDPAP